MRHIVHIVHRRADEEEHRRIIIHRDILRHLVINALEERTVGAEDRARPALCKSRRHRDRLLLCNAHIDVLTAEFCAL